MFLETETIPQSQSNPLKSIWSKTGTLLEHFTWKFKLLEMLSLKLNSSKRKWGMLSDGKENGALKKNYIFESFLCFFYCIKYHPKIVSYDSLNKYFYHQYQKYIYQKITLSRRYFLFCSSFIPIQFPRIHIIKHNQLHRNCKRNHSPHYFLNSSTPAKVFSHPHPIIDSTEETQPPPPKSFSSSQTP